MSELRRLWIPGAAGRIEAALRVACPARAAAVVAHPHPMHGGTMHNPVVFHAERELHRAGLTTLRFNFRGVEQSEGHHDNGEGEVDDVAAAASWLRGVALGLPQLLVGYSFGSVASLRLAARDQGVDGMVGIGVPVDLGPLDEIEQLRPPLAVVQGERDEFGDAGEIRGWLDRAETPTHLSVIDGGTHLFPGRAGEVADAVVAAAEWLLLR